MSATEGIETPAKPHNPKPRKRFVGTSKAGSSSSRTPVRRVANQIPDEILHDAALNEAISGLPSNYNFEVHKTIHHIRRDGVKTVALQMPEGLMVYGCAIADIIERFTDALPLLLADVTYGACCIDDYTAKEMGAEMIVHYGHSCLIPVSQTSLKTLYVFVDVAIDTPHLSLSVRRNFPSSRQAFRSAVLDAAETELGGKVPIGIDPPDHPSPSSPSSPSSSPPEELPTRLALVSTIQFVASLQSLRENLLSPLPEPDTEKLAPDQDKEGMVAKMKEREIGVWRGKYDVTIPQVRPLSPGEVLGCTAPKLGEVDALIYVGDGRFHLESIMIANPTVPAFRYDPYSKKFTRERYSHGPMRSARASSVRRARETFLSRGPGSWAVLLGTLGRQGSLSVLKNIVASMPDHGAADPPLLVLLSELSPAKLALFGNEDVGTFVQTSCPRLSIDWGYAFERPLLSTYEASVALGRIRGWEGVEMPAMAAVQSSGGSGKSCGGDSCGEKGVDTGKGDYPMDFYSDNSLGPWTPRHRPVKAA